MQSSRLMRRLAERGDAALAGIARALGHALPKHRPEEIEELRRDLAAARVGASEYRRGYLDALIEVAAAFEREAGPTRDAEDGAAAIRGTPLADVLHALNEPLLPTDLATRMNKDQASVSRCLKKLRDQGLVEGTSSQADRRRRPHRLTPEGRAVRARLEYRPDAVSREMRAAIDAIVRTLAALVQAETVPGSLPLQLMERCLPRDGAPVWEAALGAASRVGLVRERAGRLWMFSAWEKALTRSLSEARREGRRVLGPLASEVEPGTHVIVRADGADALQWTLLALGQDAAGFASCRVLGSADAQHDLQPLLEPYVLIYDSVVTLDLDRSLDCAVFKRAREVRVITDAQSPVPTPVQRLSFATGVSAPAEG